MKLSFLFLFFLFIVNQLQAQSNIKWKTTNLFMAPYLTKVTSQIVQVDNKKISYECNNFKEWVFDENGEVKYRRLVKEFDQERKLPVSPINRKQFYTSYAIKEKINFDTLVRDVSLKKIPKGLVAKNLPYYIQKNVINRIQLNGPIDVEIVVIDPSFSLTVAAKTLGLEQTAVRVYPEANEFSIELHGRDLACDLLNKNIYIKVTVPNFIELSQEEKEKIEAAYNTELLPLISNTKKEKHSERTRAVLLGFRLGEYFEKKLNMTSFETQEKAIFDYMDLLFYKNSLKFKKYFLNDEGKAHLKIPVFNYAGETEVELSL